MKFRHSGGRGDVIYALPAMRAAGGGVLYLNLRSNVGVSAPLVEQDATSFSDILVSQTYVDSVEVWRGQEFDLDLDGFRKHLGKNRHLALSHLLHAGVSADLSQPWLDFSDLQPQRCAEIVVNRTCRYHGFLDWKSLKPFQDRAVFVGSVMEFYNFITSTGLRLRYERTPTLVSLVQVIIGSRLFIGNQSLAFALAEGCKHPRILEVFPNAPNCMPNGPSGYTSLNRTLLGELLA